MSDIESGADVIDVRDIIARVENLRASLEVDEYEDERAELIVLENLLAELMDNGGDEQWEGNWYPITLIADYYFVDYAKELAYDIGAIDADANWPNMFIDWDAAAAALLTDYNEVEYGGITYYYC